MTVSPKLPKHLKLPTISEFNPHISQKELIKIVHYLITFSKNLDFHTENLIVPSLFLPFGDAPSVIQLNTLYRLSFLSSL